jgi:signal transduction histidine kinase
MRRGAWACCGIDTAARRGAWAAFVFGALLAVLGPAQAATQLRTAGFALVEGSGTLGPVPAQRGEAPATQEILLPHALPRTLAPGPLPTQVDTAWLRLEVPSSTPGPLRLYLPRWQTIGQVAVYADDRLLYRSHAGPVWNGFNHPLWLDLRDAQGAPPQVVWLRIDHLRGAGMGVSTAWIGAEADLAASRWWREWLQADLPFVASAAFLVIGIFALGAWVRRREPAYALFFVASLLFYARALHYHLGLEPLPIPEAWFGWMTVNSLAWLLPIVYFLGLRLHGHRQPRVEWPLLAVIALTSVASLPPVAVLPSVEAISPLLYLMLFFALVGITALGAWAAWRARSRDAMVVAFSNAISIPVAVHDWLLQNYRLNVEHPYLLPYVPIVLLGLFLHILLRRYLEALGHSEQANVRLEQRLKEREDELSASHARLREIERQQVLAQERERLMQDMHDGLGSSLMGALKAVEHGQAPDVAQMLRECIDDLKLAIDSLEPAQADLLLLLATLRFRLGTRLEQAGISLRWEVDDVPPLPWLDPRSALHILRILQEILGNAVKHSGATGITVRTRVKQGHVVVEVEDNGRGFEVQAADGHGRGLVHVRRRAEAIGAQALWECAAAGTRFELALPLGTAG